ncbi:MAG: hypothetical protein ACE5JN_15580 [Candidatus Methylomirabilia bacterium]
MADAIQKLPRGQRSRQSLSTSLAATRRLPAAVVRALENAERTGDTGGALRQLADLYESGGV